MRRLSSGSSEDGVTTPVEAPRFNAPQRSTDREQQSSLAPGPSSPKKLDHYRPTDHQRPSSARSRRSGNFNWKHSQPGVGTNGSVDTRSPLLLDTTTHIGPSADGASAMGGMEKTAGPAYLGRRPRPRSPWAITILTLAVSALGIGLLYAVLSSLVTRQIEPKGCRMSYMRPSYARLRDFDTEHTRFASKYSLYLYREQGIDDDTRVGPPLLSPLLFPFPKALS